LAQLEKNLIVPEIKLDDVRLVLMSGEGCAGESDEDYKDDGEKNMPDDLQQDFANFLKGKSKVQLVELIYELAQQFPEMAREISVRQQFEVATTVNQSLAGWGSCLILTVWLLIVWSLSPDGT